MIIGANNAVANPHKPAAIRVGDGDENTMPRLALTPHPHQKDATATKLESSS